MDTNKIYEGNCMEILDTFEDDSIDLIITSPPYNTGSKSLGYHPNSTTGDDFYNEYDDNLNEEEYYDLIANCIKKCLRVSRYVFWNMQMLSNNKSVLLKIITDFQHNLKDIFIWEKQAVSQIIEGRLAKGYEFILMFGKDDNMTFDYRNFPENKYVPNIQTWFKTESFPEHHATFPVKLARYFIQYFTKEGDIVCDPFAGSGTVGVACKQLNRKYVLIEIDSKYVALINKRLSFTTMTDFWSKDTHNKDLTDFDKQNPKCPSDTSLNPNIICSFPTVTN
jgi:site-specific DNA-methyltransferase (adenine-specific)